MKDPDLRTVMGWAFAAESLLDFFHVVRILLTVHSRALVFTPRNVLYLALFLAAAVLFAVASRIVLKHKPSAKIWGIVASLTYPLMLLRPYIFSTTFSW